MNERDILKQVSNKYTKMQVKSLMATSESRTIFNEHLMLASKVFVAYTKFIDKQINEKMKAVDSGFIGIFKQNEKTQMAKLYPSIEFLEAGRFKLPKWIREELNELRLGTDYAKLYGKLKQELG